MKTLFTLLLPALLAPMLSAQSFSLDPKTWLYYDLGYVHGQHPKVQSGGGFYFDFPLRSSGHWVGYLVQKHKTVVSLVGKGYLTFTIRVEATGTPIFKYDSAPDNTCDFPAHARLYFQQKGDDWSGNGPFEFYRWWANPISYELAAGMTTITVALTPDQWSSVFGKFGSDTPEATAGFQTALANIENIGITHGGGCFFTHGVSVEGGTAREEILSFSAF